MDAERWVDLVSLLRQQMDFVDDDSALNELKLRQAELLASRLADPLAATDLLEEVVALEKGLLEWEGSGRPTYSTAEEQQEDAREPGRMS